MKLIVTIEKQKDGTYIAYNTNDDNVTIIGTGDSVSAAKDDFFNSINETIEACEETGLSIPQSLKEEPEFRFDVASLFEYYKLINVSAFAEYIGINASLLRQYKLGSTYISDAQLQKIEDGIHSIGLEFTRLKLVWFTIDEWKECDIALLFLSVAGELGKFPMMKQGPIRDGLMKDGCAYVYGDVDNSKVTGPCISMAAGEGSSIQIKSSHRGDVFMFRVKNIEDHSWSEWKVLSIKG